MQRTLRVLAVRNDVLVNRQGVRPAKRNTRLLLLALLPLWLLAGTSMAALARRAMENQVDPGKHGEMSRSAAIAITRDICANVFQQSNIEVTSTVRSSAYMLRRKAPVKTWEISARAGDNEYSIRLVAETGMPFAINASVPPTGDDTRMLPEYVLEQAARANLSRLYPQPQTMELMRTARTVDATQGMSYTFNYRIPVEKCGERLLSITVDAYSGQLRSIWSPLALSLPR